MRLKLKRTIRFGCVLILGQAAVVVFVLSLATSVDAEQPPAFSERLLPVGTVPDGWAVVRDSFVASADSNRVAYRVAKGSGQAVVLDNRVGPAEAVVFGPTFSPDSSKAAVLLSNGDRGTIAVNGVNQPVQDPASAPVFSPDSQRIAYVGRDRTYRFVVVDGKHQAVVYDEVATDTITFSPDSEQLAYVARRGESWFMVVNGLESESYAGVGHPEFSGDSQRFAYWAMKPSGRWVVIADGQEDGRIQAAQQAGILFSPDSSKLGVIAAWRGQWHVVVDGWVGPGHDALGQGSVTFSPDSTHFAYAAMDDGIWGVFYDGELFAEHMALLGGGFRFSPDSERFVYGAKDETGWFIAESGRRHRSYVRLFAKSLKFSPDSKRLAYIAQNASGKATVVVDNRRWAYCDGVEDLAFSPNSLSVAWVERRGYRSSIVVDGVRGSYAFDQLVPGASLVFDSPWSFHTLVYRRPGPVFFRLETLINQGNNVVQGWSDARVLNSSDAPGLID